MIDLLMCQTTIVLQYVVVICPDRLRYLLRDRHSLSKLIVRDVDQLLAVSLWDNQLLNRYRWSANVRAFVLRLLLRTNESRA